MPHSGTKARLIFFGNERIATATTTTNPILKMLIDEGYDVAAIVLHHTFAISRNQRELEVLNLANAHDIPVHYPEKLSELHDTLAAYQADAGVLVAFGKLVPESTITLFPHGIINIHPSALPKHRGPTPVESVILDGSSETAVSIMALAREMDAGPIYAQTTVPLTGGESKQALADRLLDVSAKSLQAALPQILSGDCVAQPQDENQATYDELIEKQDGILDATKPAARLEREVRAFLDWPGTRTSLGSVDVTITKAHVSETETELSIRCGDGNYLAIDMLKPAGKKEMPTRAFLAGYKHKL